MSTNAGSCLGYAARKAWMRAYENLNVPITTIISNETQDSLLVEDWWQTVVACAVIAVLDGLAGMLQWSL
jgi:hypothetical protein